MKKKFITAFVIGVLVIAGSVFFVGENSMAYFEEVEFADEEWSNTATPEDEEIKEDPERAKFASREWWENATPEDVREEINKGADVQSVKIYSCCGGYTEEEQLCDCFGKKTIFQIPLVYAVIYNKNPEVIQVLIEAGADVNDGDGLPLAMAIRYNTPEIIKMLIDSGADLNVADRVGGSAILSAVQYNRNPEVIQILIEAGADVNVKDNDGRGTILSAVQYNKNPEVIKVLIDAGADVNAGVGNLTPLAAAIEYKAYEIIKMLIAAGADVTVEDKYQRALFASALMSNAPGVADAMIEAGVDVNTKDKNGGTLLMYATMFCNLEAVKTFIAAGADVNAKGNNGFTALRVGPMYCMSNRYKYPEIIKTLIDAGMIVEEEDKPQIDRILSSLNGSAKGRWGVDYE